MKKTFLLSIFIVFDILTVAFYLLTRSQPQYNFTVLMAGNVLMALLSVAAYFIVKKNVAERPEAFVRGVYSASFLKLMICMISILVYVMLNREHRHEPGFKPTLFMLFGIYAVYTFTETILLSKMARQK